MVLSIETNRGLPALTIGQQRIAVIPGRLVELDYKAREQIVVDPCWTKPVIWAASGVIPLNEHC